MPQYTLNPRYTRQNNPYLILCCKYAVMRKCKFRIAAIIGQENGQPQTVKQRSICDGSRNEHEYEIETAIAMIGHRIRYKIKENVFITLPVEDVAERTADIFKEKFHLGSTQYYTLKDAICVVLNQNEAATLADIGAYLTEIKEYDLRNKLEQILGKDYYGKCEIDWDEVLYGKPTLTIFQMSGLNDVKYLLAEFILMDFMRYVKQNGNEEKQCVLWADECQELKNYKHFSMHDILTTNRKFGVNALLCTQYISGNFDKSNRKEAII